MIDCSSCTVPTSNPGGVCVFCLDYQPPAQVGHIDIDRPCWLTARGDATRVEVYRSPLVKRDSRMSTPVADHLADHGLSLVYTETYDACPSEWMHGQRVREIYA
ncbi:hypothetical protein [Mycobacterium novum]